MSIMKFKVNGSPYTTIPNETLQDGRLDLSALGLLCHLLSRPGNWEIYKDQLAEQFNVHRQTIDKIMNRLIEAGYAERIELRDGGRFVGVDWIISPVAVKLPLTEKPSAVQPSAVKWTLQRKDNTNERPKQKKELTAAPKIGAEFAQDFEELWSIYPRRIAKATALAAYIARRKEGVSKADLLEAVTNYASLMRNEPPKFTLHGSTFLGPNERWCDYLTGATELVARLEEKESNLDRLNRLSRGEK